MKQDRQPPEPRNQQPGSLRAQPAHSISAETSLNEPARLLEAFFRHSTTPLVFLDRNFNFIRVNEAYARACQRSPADFPGRSHFELYPNAENQALFEQVVRSRKAYEAYGKPFVFPDHPEWGDTYWNWRLTPLLDEHGQVEYLVFALEDVTERTKAEQQLQALNQTLHRRTQQLRALASDLTLAEQRERHRLAQLLHDHLQQLLVGAKFRASPLHRSSDPQIAQAARDIDDLLDQSIAASRSLTAELSPPILHEAGLIPALEWLCGSIRQTHGLQIKYSFDPHAEPRSADVRVLLFQSVRELLLNTIKHSGVKVAQLHATAVDGQTRILVADGGKGFDPAAADPGAGMRGFGLFSIQERVDSLGGRVEIDSAPGRGTRVTLYAPMGHHQPPEPAAAPTTTVSRPAARTADAFMPSPHEKNRIRVLLVDDHAVTRQGLQRLLMHEPLVHVVGEATDGLQAIEQTRHLKPDVVIMDVSMPGMSGIDATRHIHGEFPGVRIIGLSMFAHDERGAEMRQAGAAAYFTKSGPPQHLVQAICESAAARPGKPASAPTMPSDGAVQT
jgi:PAS domain S-box-containing protein